MNIQNSFVPVCRIKIPENPSDFVANRWFVKDTRPEAGVKIADLDFQFTDGFLNGAGMVEKPTVGTTLRCDRLWKELNYREIVAGLGGDVTAESSLFQLFSQLERQGNGEHGVLAVNGHWNIRFIRNAMNILCVVCVRWRHPGWVIDAGAVECECCPNINHFVFYPDPPDSLD